MNSSASTQASSDDTLSEKIEPEIKP